jgi:hypothetical protein
MSNLKYGVELEMNVPHGSYSRYGGGYAGTFAVPDGWSFRRDGSLSANSGMNAVELVSPILEGSSGMRQVREVCRGLAAGGAKVNATCGLHVHIDAKNFTKSMVESLKEMARVHEFALYGLSGTKIERRMISSHGRSYCKPSQYWRNASYNGDRYRSLNVSNWEYAQRSQGQPKNTVEFRCFAGTVDTEEVVAAILMARGLTGGMYNAYNAEKEEMLPDGNESRDKLPIVSMRRVIDTYFYRGSAVFSGINLDIDTKAKMLSQAAKAERKLITL